MQIFSGRWNPRNYQIYVYVYTVYNIYIYYMIIIYIYICIHHRSFEYEIHPPSSTSPIFRLVDCAGSERREDSTQHDARSRKVPFCFSPG